MFALEMDGRLPSWNEILGMEHWARYQLKKSLASDFMSALQASVGTSLTKITYAKNSTSTYAATLARYQVTQREKRKLRSARKKLEAKNESSPESKSSDFEDPPF